MTKTPSTARVSLNAEGMRRIREIAELKGITARQMLEAYMNFAITQYERPGSWEAQGFELGNYMPDGLADRWF